MLVLAGAMTRWLMVECVPFQLNFQLILTTVSNWISN